MEQAYGENTLNLTLPRGDVKRLAAPWHFLYFLSLPQGQGSLRPTLFILVRLPLRRSSCHGVTATPASFTFAHIQFFRFFGAGFSPLQLSSRFYTGAPEIQRTAIGQHYHT
jgi:hypothetical protein